MNILSNQTNWFNWMYISIKPYRQFSFCNMLFNHPGLIRWFCSNKTYVAQATPATIINHPRFRPNDSYSRIIFFRTSTDPALEEKAGKFRSAYFNFWISNHNISTNFSSWTGGVPWGTKGEVVDYSLKEEGGEMFVVHFYFELQKCIEQFLLTDFITKRLFHLYHFKVINNMKSRGL